MITIDFALSHSFIRIVKRTLVTSQSQNYVQARFDLRSDDWTAPITAIFKADNDNNAYSMLIDKNNTCIIPWEVLRNAGTVNVSAFCGDRHTANIAQFTVVQSGYTECEMPSEPTPTVYEQILKNFEGKQDKLAAGNSTGQATETVNEIGGTETTYNVNGKVSVTYRGGQPYVANNFTFNESKNSDNYEGVGFTLSNANGYINAMGYGKEEYDWLLLPSEIGGTSALPVGDFFYVTSDLNDYRIVLGGGSWNYGSFDGSFFGRCGYNVGSRDRSAGGRLLYVPTAKV